jgi:hypothetical protein
MTTPAETVKFLDVDKKTILHWTSLFSEFLSKEANPRKGQEREYTFDDLCVFAIVKDYWEESPDLESIRILLNTETTKRRNM